MKDDMESLLPRKAWFTLKEICAYKGINYKTALNKPLLRPRPEETIAGRKMYSRKAVIEWLGKTDKDLLNIKVVPYHDPDLI